MAHAKQRALASVSDGSHWVYQYDSLGQVVSGKRYLLDGTLVAGQQFGYTFDQASLSPGYLHNDERTQSE
jgi:hypothetical protein